MHQVFKKLLPRFCQSIRCKIVFTWNIFNRNFSDTFPVASEAGVDFPDLGLLSFDQLLQDFLLLSNDSAELCVHYLRVQFTAHEGGTFVILDVSLVDGFG